MPRKIKRELGDHNDYNYFQLMNHNTEEQLRDEYKRMAKQAKRQITAIKKSPFKDNKIVDGKDFLSQNPDNMTKSDLAHNLSTLDSFLSSKLSTVTGLREQRKLSIERLHDRGYNFINTRNYKAFGELMDDMRAYINNNIITSQKVLDAVDNLVTKRNVKSLDKITQVLQKAFENNISLANVQKNFSFYWENMDEISDLQLNPDRKRKYTKTELERKMRGAKKWKQFII